MMKANPDPSFNVSEVEIVYHNKVPVKKRIKVSRSSDAHEILKSSWNMNKIELLEEFKILMLDRGGHCLGISSIATGGISGCLIDVRIIFVTALMAKASSIILAHNHPSGLTNPSRADIDITEKLMLAGKVLDIDVRDHLILTADSYSSFQDEGYMPL